MSLARNATPAPRPALRKADDAAVHPAAARVADATTPMAVPSQARSGKEPSAKKRKTATKFQGATSDVIRRDSTSHDLLSGSPATLEVQIPKRLRKAARAQAARHDTTLDAVVTGLLAGWVDGS